MQVLHKVISWQDKDKITLPTYEELNIQSLLTFLESYKEMLQDLNFKGPTCNIVMSIYNVYENLQFKSVVHYDYHGRENVCRWTPSNLTDVSDKGR